MTKKGAFSNQDRNLIEIDNLDLQNNGNTAPKLVPVLFSTSSQWGPVIILSNDKNRILQVTTA